MPAGHLRVGRERREFPADRARSRPGPNNCQTRWAVSSSRLLPPHPVRRSPTRSSSRRYRTQKSPDASRGVWAKASGTDPRSFLVLGIPPCTEMTLSWVSVRASSRSKTHRRLGAKSQELAHDRWIVSELSAEENPLELQPHRKWLDRKYGRACSLRHVEAHTQLLTAQRPGSGVANGLFATQFLPMIHFDAINLQINLTTDRTPNDSGLVRSWHPSSRASQSSSTCRANSRY